MKINITFDLTDEQRKAINCASVVCRKGVLFPKADYDSCRQAIIDFVDHELSDVVASYRASQGVYE